MGCGRKRFVESALSDICHTRCSIAVAANALHTPPGPPPAVTAIDYLIRLIDLIVSWRKAAVIFWLPSLSFAAAGGRAPPFVWRRVKMENCSDPIRFFLFFSFFFGSHTLSCLFLTYFIFILFFLSSASAGPSRLRLKKGAKERERRKERKFPLSEHFALQLENFNWALGAAALIRPSP